MSSQSVRLENKADSANDQCQKQFVRSGIGVNHVAVPLEVCT